MTTSKLEGRAREFQRQMLETFKIGQTKPMLFNKRLDAMYQMYSMLGKLQDAVFTDEIWSEEEVMRIHANCLDLATYVMEFDLEVTKHGGG